MKEPNYLRLFDVSAVVGIISFIWACVEANSDQASQALVISLLGVCLFCVIFPCEAAPRLERRWRIKNGCSCAWHREKFNK